MWHVLVEVSSHLRVLDVILSLFSFYNFYSSTRIKTVSKKRAISVNSKMWNNNTVVLDSPKENDAGKYYKNLRQVPWTKTNCNYRSRRELVPTKMTKTRLRIPETCLKADVLKLCLHLTCQRLCLEIIKPLRVSYIKKALVINWSRRRRDDGGGCRDTEFKHRLKSYQQRLAMRFI